MKARRMELNNRSRGKNDRAKKISLGVAEVTELNTCSLMVTGVAIWTKLSCWAKPTDMMSITTLCRNTYFARKINSSIRGGINAHHVSNLETGWAFHPHLWFGDGAGGGLEGIRQIRFQDTRPFCHRELHSLRLQYLGPLRLQYIHPLRLQY